MHPAHMGGTHALLTAVDHAHAQELVLLRTMGRHSADRPVLRAPAGVNSALNTPSFRAAPGTAKEGARSHALGVRQEAPRPKPLLNRQVNRGDSKASIADQLRAFLIAKLTLVRWSLGRRRQRRAQLSAWRRGLGCYRRRQSRALYNFYFRSRGY